MAEVTAVHQVDRALFALLREQLRTRGWGREQERASRSDIRIAGASLIEGCEPIQQRKCIIGRGSELEHSVAEVAITVPVAIAAGDKDIAVGIDWGSSPCHPDTTLRRFRAAIRFPVRCRVPDSFLCEGAGA